MSDYQTIQSKTDERGRKVFHISPSLKISGKHRKPSRLFTLRTRLIGTIIILVALPVSLMAFIYNRNTEQILIDTTNRVMYSAANQTATEIESFLNSRLEDVEKNAQSNEIKGYLSLPEVERPGSLEEEKAQSLLQSLHTTGLSTNAYFLSYMLFNLRGEILIDTSGLTRQTSIAYLGLDQADPALFQSLVQTGNPYISSVIFPFETGQPILCFISQVVGDQQPRGFLVMGYDPAVLQVIVVRYNGLAGPDSFALLVDDIQMRLAQGIYPEMIYKTIIPIEESQVSQKRAIFRLPPNEENSTHLPELAKSLVANRPDQPYVSGRFLEDSREIYTGVIDSLKTKPWLVVYIQPQSAFLAPVREQMMNTLWLGLLITGVIVLFALLVSRLLTNPIMRLTQVAAKVSQGDFSVQAAPEPGEFGLLADGFNTMTGVLKNTLDGLERRINERTSELAHASEQMRRRANRLQAVAEVAHTITSMQDIDRLLPKVTQLISERFGYYHAGIFLLDQDSQYATLQAANSEGGQRMLARGHQLKVGQEGIVGYVTSTGESRVASDVGADIEYFDNPDLPMTRSEVTVPLQTAGKIIGALDVQSTEPNAFNDEDIAILGTLANQVAIAIQNSRLFSETNQALQELRSLHSQYLQQAWTQVAEERAKSGYQYRFGRIIPVPADSSDQIWMQVRAGKPVVVPSTVTGTGDELTEDTATTVLLAPISVRNQVIGVLHLPSPDKAYQWDEEDINMVQEVTDQIGLALENARLLEQSQLRAEREHMVAEITTKLRASNDLQEIIRTATRELRQALHAKQARLVVRTPINSPQTGFAISTDPIENTSEEQTNINPES